MNSEILKKIAIGALALLALVVSIDSALGIFQKYNGTSKLEIENAILEAEADSLRGSAQAATVLAQYWAARAATAQTKQTIINKYYNEKATTIFSRPFAVRSRVFSTTLFGLDTLDRNGN